MCVRVGEYVCDEEFTVENMFYNWAKSPVHFDTDLYSDCI